MDANRPLMSETVPQNHADWVLESNESILTSQATRIICVFVLREHCR